jgi:hypothetical protein
MRFHEEQNFEEEPLRAYPDAKSHREQYFAAAAEAYREGLDKNGLKPNETVNRAFFHKTLKEAQTDYQNRRDEVFLHNFKAIEASSKREMRRIKRDGTRQAFVMCPPIALVFGVLAAYNFSKHDVATGITCAAGAVAFLGILVGKYLFDR